MAKATPTSTPPSPVNADEMRYAREHWQWLKKDPATVVSAINGKRLKSILLRKGQEANAYRLRNLGRPGADIDREIRQQITQPDVTTGVPYHDPEGAAELAAEWEASDEGKPFAPAPKK